MSISYCSIRRHWQFWLDYSWVSFLDRCLNTFLVRSWQTSNILNWNLIPSLQLTKWFCFSGWTSITIWSNIAVFTTSYDTITRLELLTLRQANRNCAILIRSKAHMRWIRQLTVIAISLFFILNTISTNCRINDICLAIWYECYTGVTVWEISNLNRIWCWDCCRFRITRLWDVTCLICSSRCYITIRYILAWTNRNSTCFICNSMT